MGDAVHHTKRRILPCCPLCRWEFHPRACSGMVWRIDCGDSAMRTHKQIVVYESILQVLQDSGCPFCRLLKEYQAARLQNHWKENTHRLCNFHLWGMAAVQNAPIATKVFIKLVDESLPVPRSEDACD